MARMQGGLAVPYALIARFSLSALGFGLAACAICLCVRRARGGGWRGGSGVAGLIAAGYLAALVQIIGLRLGLVPIRPMGGEWRFIPLRTTLQQWRMGRGSFIYHTVGNLIWFVPLGALLGRICPRCRRWQALLAGAAVSLLLEALQFLLGSGISDVDDILLNALGALLGHALWQRLRRGRA